MFHSGGDGDEDVDFNVTSTSSTKLASLFSFEQAPKDQSLTYTAPKQPKKPDEQKQAASASSVVSAFVVHAFKFENQQYGSQGKLGAAIVANHDALSYKLILYKGKQQHVAFATITTSFVLKVQANKYGSFYDDQRDSWSILFDTDQNSIDFAKQIALAKANSAGTSLNTVLVQDLTFIEESNGLEMGDSVEVKYSGWLLQNHTIGQLFDTNNGSEKLMKIKLGKTKIIKGWEEGMIGAKKNQKRLIVIPPALGYGSQAVTDKVPANCTLIFEILITKVKCAKESSRSATPNSSHDKEPLYIKKMDPVKIDTSTSAAATDESVKARGASISEQLSQSPKTEKAKIISRMAKMGTPMLPMQGTSVVHQSSESETEDDLVKRRSLTSSPARESSPKPIIKPRPINPSLTPHGDMHPIHAAMPQSAVQQHHQLALYQQQYPNPAGLPYTYPFQPPQPMATMFAHPAPPVAPTSSVNDAHLPILMSENRTQNSEVRMVLNKLGDKMDLVLSKLDQSKTVSVPNQSLMPYMDSTVLMQNIERIVLENTKWKNDLEEKNQKIQTLNEKICVLLEKNQRLVEESNNMMEKRSDTFQSSSVQSQSRLVSLEKEKLKLSDELSDALAQISQFKLRLQKSQNEAQEKLGDLLEGNSEKFQDQLAKLQKDLNDKNTILLNLEAKLEEAENTKRDLSSKIENLQEQCQSAQSSNESLSKVLDKSKEELLKTRAETDEEIIELKSQYEGEIRSLKQRISEETSKTKNDKAAPPEEWSKEKDELERDVVSFKQQIQNLEEQKSQLELKLSRRSEIPVSTPWENKLKRAMTGLYRSLQQEIESGTSYEADEILQIVLQSIRTVTSAVLDSEATDRSFQSSREDTGGGVAKVQKETRDEQLNDFNKISDEENTSVGNEIKSDQLDVTPPQDISQDQDKGQVEKEPLSEVNSLTDVKSSLSDSSKASPKIESLNFLIPTIYTLKTKLHDFGLAVGISMLIAVVAFAAFSLLGR